jgi:hypothetical protein
MSRYSLVYSLSRMGKGGGERDEESPLLSTPLALP